MRKKLYNGLIKRWEIHKLSFGPAVFTGTIVEGSWKFEPGDHMRSTEIMKIMKEEEYWVVETRNSIYHLLVGSRGDDVCPLRGDAVLALLY